MRLKINVSNIEARDLLTLKSDNTAYIKRVGNSVYLWVIINDGVF